MRIGFVPGLDGGRGGVYQYSLTMLDALHALEASGRLREKMVILAKEVDHPLLTTVKDWPVRQLTPPPPMSRRWLSLLHRALGDKGYGLLQKARQLLRKDGGRSAPLNLDVPLANPAMGRWFRKCGAELMLYPVPTRLAFEAGVPYVMAIHDLQHRGQPEFPEVSAQWEGAPREYLFRNGARQATLLLADSETGKEDILNFYGPYGVKPDQVKVLPFLPASYLAITVSDEEVCRVREVHRLPERYFFYPAQFWPHKNHRRIVEALGLLARRHGVKIPIAFSGSHSGSIREKTFDEVTELARQLGLEEEVRYLGYVSDQDMSGLYAAAVALIMPTFFGPTNIPILEAWSLGCPVLTSDIRGVREQAGNAAVLAEPHSVEAIAEGLWRLWTDQNLRAMLVERGRVRLAAYTPEDFRLRLAEILDEAAARVRSGRQEAGHSC